MSTCIREGVKYKRHNWVEKDGITVCTKCDTPFLDLHPNEEISKMEDEGGIPQ